MNRRASVRQARTLRRNPSATERLLWTRLRQKRLGGLKFRRQMPLGPYILDFVCLRHRLIVEADGPFHDADDDARRDVWLTGKGFRILRFSNTEICGSPDLVAGRILSAVEELPPVPEL